MRIASKISDHNESVNKYFFFLDIYNPFALHINLSSIIAIITSKIYISNISFSRVDVIRDNNGLTVVKVVVV